MKTDNTVVDKKLTDEEIGKIYRKTNEMIRRLNEGTIHYPDVLDGMQRIIEGKSRRLRLDLIPQKHIIDTDADPFIPEGFTLMEHKKSGLLKLDVLKISLYLSEKQKRGGIKANNLKKELSSKPVMNANVLDYLLEHQELIPEEWKSESIFFWGTIYCDLHNNPCVRYLYWLGSKWYWSCCAVLDGDFSSNLPAAVMT